MAGGGGADAILAAAAAAAAAAVVYNCDHKSLLLLFTECSPCLCFYMLIASTGCH